MIETMGAWPDMFAALLDGFSESSAYAALVTDVEALHQKQAEHKTSNGTMVAEALGDLTAGQALFRDLTAGEARADLCQKCLFFLKKTSMISACGPLVALLEAAAKAGQAGNQSRQ